MPEIDEPVHVTEYSNLWPTEFAAEHARLVGTMKLPSEDLQHIGSTSVPGLAAKPTIDLMLGVARFPPPESLIQRVVEQGYVALGEAGVPGRLYFRQRGRTGFNLHLVEKGGGHWVNNLALRDYLRANAMARERYAQAKRSALAAGATTLLTYSAAKAPVLDSLLHEALAPQDGGLPRE